MVGEDFLSTPASISSLVLKLNIFRVAEFGVLVIP